MKRIISWLLAVALLLTLAMPVAIAADERKSGEFTYRIKGNGTAVITGYDWANNQGKDIYIPRMIDGYTVTEIGEEAFAVLSYDDNHVIQVKSPNKAGSLVLPDTITSLGDRAFMGIQFDVYSITIPSSVQYIGKGAFSGLVGIKQFVVAEGNANYATIDGVLYNKSQKSLIAYPSSNEKDVDIPEGIRSVEDYALFGACPQIASNKFVMVSFPDTITSIGSYSFARLDEKVRFSGLNSMTQMGEGAFYKAAITFNLYFGKVSEIPPYAYYGVNYGNIYEVALPSNLKSIGDYAFANSTIFIREDYSTTFPDSLESIGDYAFYNWSTWPSSLVNPKTRLNLSNTSVKTVGDYAFSNANVYPDIVFPSCIEEIGDCAFAIRYTVDSITLPSSITYLGENFCNRSTRLNVTPGTYGAIWASDNGYITAGAGGEDTSWLND